MSCRYSKHGIHCDCHVTWPERKLPDNVDTETEPQPTVHDVWERSKAFSKSWNEGTASIADLEDFVQAIAAFNNTTVSVGLLWMMGFTILPPGANLTCPACGATHAPTGLVGTSNGLHPRSHFELVQATEKPR